MNPFTHPTRSVTRPPTLADTVHLGAFNPLNRALQR
jgi:hypothetical protein